MKNQPPSSRKASVGREERSSTATTASKIATVVKTVFEPEHEVIKMAIDMHGRMWMISRQLDNATPQPPQEFTPADAMRFIEKQVKLGRRVVCCYEAGCFGFAPQRKIQALGTECLVIAPQNWDPRQKKVRTDRTDTNEMVQRLDRYVAGNRKALAVVRVPNLADEVWRSRVRQRKQLQSSRNRWANMGKSLLLNYGMGGGWSWWKPRRWEQTQKLVREEMGEHADAVMMMLEVYRKILMFVNERLDALTTEQIEKQKQRKSRLPRLRGIGERSLATIEAEIHNWDDFHNRRQISSYTGLCPGVVGTAGNFTGLSVNKCGNRRLRSVLVEVAWLLLRYQPGYRPLQRYQSVFKCGSRPLRKKAIVAIARQLAVDLWRIATGRTTPQNLGLKLAT